MTAEDRGTGPAQWRRRASERLSGFWGWARANPTAAYGFLIPVVAVVKLAAVAGFDTSVAYTILRNDSLATIGGLTLGALGAILLLSILVIVGIRLGSWVGQSDWPGAKALSSAQISYLFLYLLPLMVAINWVNLSYYSSVELPHVLLSYLFLLSYVGSAFVSRHHGVPDEVQPESEPVTKPESEEVFLHQSPEGRAGIMQQYVRVFLPVMEKLLTPVVYIASTLVVVVLLVLWLPEPWHQRETLQMNDGEVLDGYVLEDSGRWITFLDEETRSIAQVEIEKVLARN